MVDLQQAAAVGSERGRLGHRLGGQGDLSARYDLLSASSLSLVIGLLYVFSSWAAGCKLAAPSLRVRNPALTVLGGLFAEAFDVSGVTLSFVILGFSVLQMM